MSGAQARLRNLGYDAPPEGDGARGSHRLAGVLSAFQRDQHLPVTGQLDANTAAKLKEAFGG